MKLRTLVARAVLLASLLVAGAIPRTAHAWQEAHQASDDVHVTIDGLGVAHLEHTIAFRIVRGPLRAFEITGVEKNVVVAPDATITGPDGQELTAHVESVPEKKLLRVSVDEPRALMRGTFVFHVKYAVDLVASQELVRDGAMWRLVWTAPVASEGFDGGRVVFALPPAPTPPRAVHPETGNADGSVLATLKRTPLTDELELIRPHVARGEAAAWALRIDPKAFPEIHAPELRPPAPPPPPPPDPLREVALGVGLFALALAFALLVRHKDRAFAALCGDARPKGIVPLPGLVRGLLAGAALAAGIALQVFGRPTLAAASLALAMLFAAIRPPSLRAAARGPGKWLAIRPEEAFAPPRARATEHWLDIGVRAGKIAALVFAAALVGLGFASRLLDSEGPYLVVLDSVVLLPIFFTGRAAQLPPNLARAPARPLRALFRRMKKRAALRVVPWARVPMGQSVADELRLLVLPRIAMPGLLGIEVGVAWGRTPTGYAGAPEILVRVQESTSAAARIALLAPFARPVPGRRHDERVFRIVPRIATRTGTLALIERLAGELVDRRMKIAEREWRGGERRVARNGRAKAAA